MTSVQSCDLASLMAAGDCSLRQRVMDAGHRVVRSTISVASGASPVGLVFVLAGLTLRRIVPCRPLWKVQGYRLTALHAALGTLTGILALLRRVRAAILSHSNHTGYVSETLGLGPDGAACGETCATECLLPQAV